MYKLALINGEIIDPVEGRYKANIGIDKGKIQEITTNNIEAEEYIDLKGLKISPGFVDIHFHENALEEGKINPEFLRYEAAMGVTTAAGGNCGLNFSGHQPPEYFELLKEVELPLNYMSFVGYNSIREEAGFSPQKPLNKGEFAELIPEIKRNLNQGACGVSVGLEYTPAISTQEMLWLGNVMTEYPNKVLAAHYRFDANRSLEAIAEMIIVARETGVPFQISHIGSCSAFGRMDRALEMIREARKEGVDVKTDVYPYAAFSTFIGSEVFAPGCFERWDKSYDSLLVANGQHQGEWCTEELFNKLRREEPDTQLVAFVMEEEEVDKAVAAKDTIIGSDGHLKDGGGHPRLSGTFPRVISEYVRERGLLSLEEAVKKMSFLPAQRLGLEDRGRIKEGFAADICIFDYDRIEDQSTFQEPLQTPSGIEYLLVNGELIIREGEFRGGGSGNILK